MGIVAGCAFHCKSVAGVVQTNIGGIEFAVAIVVEIGDVVVCGVGRFEVHARPGGGILGADRMVIAEVGAKVEYGEIGSCARKWA